MMIMTTQNDDHMKQNKMCDPAVQQDGDGEVMGGCLVMDQNYHCFVTELYITARGGKVKFVRL